MIHLRHAIGQFVYALLLWPPYRQGYKQRTATRSKVDQQRRSIEKEEIANHNRHTLGVSPGGEEGQGIYEESGRSSHRRYSRIGGGLRDHLCASSPLWISTKGRGREFAELVSHLAEELYPEAEKIRLMVDKLNIHSAAWPQLAAAVPTAELVEDLARLAAAICARYA